MDASRASIAHLAEKVVMTFLQAFASFLLMPDTVLDLAAGEAAILAGVAAAGTALAANLPVVPEGLSFWPDLVARTVRTYAVTFLTLFFGAERFVPSIDSAKAAAIAAAPAALAIAKGLLARRTGDHDDAALSFRGSVVETSGFIKG